jgi:RNA polymerase sigma-70 factor (ECF subfamily)
MPTPDALPTDLTALLPKLDARARRLCDGGPEAEDMVQATVLKLWQLRRQGYDFDDLERYGMTVLRNEVRQRWRSHHPCDALEDAVLAVPEGGPARLACSEIASAIDRLPEEQATLMRLVAEGETSPAVLARRLDLSPGTVMSRLARARARLRADLGLDAKASVRDLF